MNFYAPDGTLLAKGCLRLVCGGRGDYLEFAQEHICWENFHIPADQAYRLSPPWDERVFYIEFRSNGPSNIKLYFQRRLVSYADYRIGCCYLSPDDLIDDRHLTEHDRFYELIAARAAS